MLAPLDSSEVARFAETHAALLAAIGRVFVGQEEVASGLVACLFAGGHVLLEGAPGLGKTLLARALALASGSSFKRIQFTPDLMPSDVTGSSIYSREAGAFTFVPGPVFAHVVLADEINRAPAKTQSALLEAMQEHTVTVDGVSRPLPPPFVVMATQNPIESQGTYPLPEAQLDRFLLKLTIAEPPREEEEAIVRRHAGGFDPNDLSAMSPVLDPARIVELQRIAARVRVDEALVAYLVEIVRRTRSDRAIEIGASPRASLALLRVSQVLAAAAGRTFVTPDDVKPLAFAVLRHRIQLHPDAELQGVRADDCIEGIVRAVPVPRGQAT